MSTITSLAEYLTRRDQPQAEWPLDPMASAAFARLCRLAAELGPAGLLQLAAQAEAASSGQVSGTSTLRKEGGK